MKKLLILILLLTPLMLFSEEVILDTPFDKEIFLPIPEDYDELKPLTIEIAELYWGERYDLEQKLKDEKKLLDKIDKLKKRLEESNKEIERLKIALKNTQDLLEEKIKPDVFGWGINITGGAMLKGGEPALMITGNPYIQLFEAVNVGIELGYPLQLSLQFGIQF